MNDARRFSAKTNSETTSFSISSFFSSIHLSVAGAPTCIQSNDLFCWDMKCKTLQLTRLQLTTSNRVLFTVGSHCDDKLLLQDVTNDEIDQLLEEIAVSAKQKVKFISSGDGKFFYAIYSP